MRTFSTDTDTSTERLWIEKMRRLPGWRRMELASKLSTAAREMCKAGLKARHRGASQAELHRRFVEIQLGKALAAKFLAARKA